MSNKVAFIHTISTLVAPFNDLASELFPEDTTIYHIADEMLLKIVLADGGLSPFIYRRVAQHVADAAAAGVDLIQVTCSSISPCIDPARKFVDIPVLKIDQPMVNEALSIGSRIGIAATAPTTLGPTTDLVQSCAESQGKVVEVDSVLCRGAFDALFANDIATHDRIVLETLSGLVDRNDVVILAQASMARVADKMPESEKRVPILSSPRLAMEYAAKVLSSSKK